MTVRITRDALAALTDDGKVVELDDGWSLKLNVEHDEFYDPFDGDFYGKVEEARRDRDTGLDVRPSGFDGNAEKFWVYNHKVWWQPPTDVPRTHVGFDKLREAVKDLLLYGGYRVVLEIREGVDAYGKPIVRDFASLGGIDSLENDYLAEVVRELAGEFEHIDVTVET